MTSKRKLVIIGLVAAVLFFVAFETYRHYNYAIYLARIIESKKVPTFRYIIDKPKKSKNEFLLLTPYKLSRWKDGQLLVMDTEGKIYFQKNTKGAAICFRRWDIGGRVYYTYLLDDEHVYHIPKISMAAGKVVLTNAALQTIKEIRLLPYKDITITKNEGLDLHDFILLSESHYIAMAVYEKAVHNIPAALNPMPGIKVDAPVIQEVEDGKVVWQWDASNYPELYSSSKDDNNFSDTGAKHDYLHINSISIDPHDSNLICSFRHSSQVVKISRKNGDIIWKLGGMNSDFKLQPNQVFLNQHHATVMGNTLMVFDNGDSARRKSSRIVEFVLDEKGKAVDSFKELILPEPFSLYMGSVEKQGDSYIIAGGTGNYLLEINPNTKEKYFEMHCNLAMYRAYRVNDIDSIPRTIEQISINGPLKE